MQTTQIIEQTIPTDAATDIVVETPAVPTAPYSRDDEEVELPRFLRMPSSSSIFSGWGPRVRN